jgi:hypothetical protein
MDSLVFFKSKPGASRCISAKFGLMRRSILKREPTIHHLVHTALLDLLRVSMNDIRGVKPPRQHEYHPGCGIPFTQGA